MSAVMTQFDNPAGSVSVSRRRSVLWQVLAGAAAFDAGMGIAFLATPATFGRWLSIGQGDVRITGIVFLLAAIVGVETALRPSLGVRWVAGANLLFAAWCLTLVGVAGPNALGEVLLAGAAVTSTATALFEHRLGR